MSSDLNPGLSASSCDLPTVNLHPRSSTGQYRDRAIYRAIFFIHYACVHVHVHVCVISQIPLTPALILRHVKYILYINLTYKIRDLCQKKSRTSACIIKRILTRTF